MEEKKNESFLLTIFVDDELVDTMYVHNVDEARNELKKFKFLLNPSGYVFYKIFKLVCEGDA